RRHDMAGASGADAASLVTTGRALAALYNWTFLLGQTLMPGINALLLGSLLYRSRLVPRILPTLGLVGAPILIASVITTMFRVNHHITVLAGIGTLPIAVWEFSLGVWLVAKGFKSCPITAANIPSPGRDPEGELVSSIA
ncbi:MAG: hypothetical protein QOF30_27, partial [Acidimicrobiaceae bacterium]|nr:hypothetical protein [Acidimicrobiaceae bacterium]